MDKGSRDGKQDILYGRAHPVLWNPADTYWVDKLNLDWRNPKVGKHDRDAIRQSETILTTRLVLLMWDDRARVFQAAMQRPEYKGKTWSLLRTIATRGWSAVGGPGAWGKLKLMQSDPTKSNSGQSALALMFAEYRREHPSATATDPGFARFMQDIQGQVGSFGETTSKVMESMINGGPDSADMAVVYETNALTAVDKGATNVRVVYPEPTLVQEYPAAIVDAPWVTPDKAEVAREYVRYLLRPEVQKRAVEYGLRPALLELRGAVDTAFASGNRAQTGFKLDTQTVIRPVSTVIMDAVLYQWYKRYGKP